MNRFWVSIFLVGFFAGAGRGSGGTLELKEKIPNVADLRAIVELENARKWLSCAQKSWPAMKTHTEISDWVYAKGFRCARLSKNKPEMAKAYSLIGNFFSQLKFPTARQTLLKELQRSFQVADADSTAALVKPAEYYLSWADKTEKDGRARAFEILGNFFYEKKDFESAREQYVLSLREKETRHPRERLGLINIALKVPPPTANAVTEKNDDYEAPFADRLAQSIKKKDLLAQLEDLVDYTAQFPGGRKSKNAQDQMSEILTLMIDRDTFRNQTLRVLQKANPAVLFEIVRFFYRKSDYRDCATLGEQVPKGGVGGLPQFLTAKCNHLIGEYKKARDLFESYLLAYPSADEAGEARLRLTILNYRLEQDANVISAVEKYLKGPKNDRYDLWIRYWYVRSLQRAKNAQAQAAALKLIADYPVTYYGLILLGEANNQTLRAEDLFSIKVDPSVNSASPTNDKTPTEVETTVDSASTTTPNAATPTVGSPSVLPPVMSPPQIANDTSKTVLTPLATDRWHRFRVLAGGGWSEEASKEADELSLSIPPEDWGTWAHLLAGQKIYALSIRLSGQLFDRNPALRTFDLLKETFPKAFEKDVTKSSGSAHLSPFLTWSLMRQESAYQRNIVSVSNAMGLMQLIPPTGEEVARDLHHAHFDASDDLFDTSINIQFGTNYLAKLLRGTEKSVPWALASYNAGPTKVEQYLRARKLNAAEASKADEWLLLIDELPTFETSFYVKAILRNVLIYKLIDQKKVQSPLDDWRTLVAN